MESGIQGSFYADSNPNLCLISHRFLFAHCRVHLHKKLWGLGCQTFACLGDKSVSYSHFLLLLACSTFILQGYGSNTTSSVESFHSFIQQRIIKQSQAVCWDWGWRTVIDKWWRFWLSGALVLLGILLIRNRVPEEISVKMKAESLGGPLQGKVCWNAPDKAVS